MKKRSMRLYALMLGTCLTVTSFTPAMAAEENVQQTADTVSEDIESENSSTSETVNAADDSGTESDTEESTETTQEVPVPENPAAQVEETQEIQPAQESETHTTDPSLATSWKVVEWNGEKVYGLYENETDDKLCTGVKTFGDVSYYFDETEAKLLTGKVEINGQYFYYVPADAAIRNDATSTDEIAPWNSNMGQMKKDFFYTDGTDTYYFGTDGVMVVNGIATDAKTGKTYYFDAEGKMVKKNAWLHVGSVWYYLNSDYSLVIKQFKTIGKPTYYFDAEGKMAQGFLTLGSDMYYFQDNGYQKNSGWFKVDNKWYYAQTTGVLKRGWLIENGNYYYLDPDTRVMGTGWITTPDGTSYYMNGSGVRQTSKWVFTNKKWYYVGVDGRMVTGWKKIKGIWYYLDPKNEGAMATGWVSYGKKWCWCNSSGAMAVNKWLYLDKTYYYADSNGYMLTGWQKIGSKWYYLGDDGSGKMLTGWQKVNGKWYYLRSNGVMMTGGWHKIGGRWYYMNDTGSMRSGWQKIGSKWYYLGSAESGAMVANKWQQINSKWYYFYSSGAMAADEYLQYTDGKICYVNGSGAKTTGNALQAAIANAMTEAGVTNAMTDYQKLRACYDWLLDDCEYAPNTSKPVSGWTTTYATELLTNKSGGNYNFSAAFGQLARAIGYKDMKIIRGTVPNSSGGTSAHSWCDLNGKLYDVIYEMQSSKGSSGFNINYSATGMTYTAVETN